MRRSTLVYISIAAVVAVAAAGVAVFVIRQPETVEPAGNPFGSEEETFAAVPATLLPALERIVEPETRLILARCWGMEGRGTGADIELRPLIAFLGEQRSDREPPRGAANEQRSIAVASCLSALAGALDEHAGYSEAVRRDAARQALRYTADAQDMVQVASFLLLKVVYPEAESRPPEVRAAMETRSARPYVDNQSERALAAMREAAAGRGK